MTTLKRVDKEDLEEGNEYVVFDGFDCFMLRVISGRLHIYQTENDTYEKISLGEQPESWQFYGPIELEG